MWEHQPRWKGKAGQPVPPIQEGSGCSSGPESKRRAKQRLEGPCHSLTQSAKNLRVNHLCKSLCIKGEAGASKRLIKCALEKKKSEPDVAGAAECGASPAASAWRSVALLP